MFGDPSLARRILLFAPIMAALSLGAVMLANSLIQEQPRSAVQYDVRSLNGDQQVFPGTVGTAGLVGPAGVFAAQSSLADLGIGFGLEGPGLEPMTAPEPGATGTSQAPRLQGRFVVTTDGPNPVRREVHIEEIGKP